MKVIIRLPQRTAVSTAPGLNRRMALMLSSLMTPIALMAWALAGWRLAADAKWTGEFAITKGLFSHWQVWIALGIGIQFVAFLLHRAGRNDDLDGDGALL